MKKIAEYLKSAVVFDTKKEMEDYLREHPKSNPANHSVRQTSDISEKKFKGDDHYDKQYGDKHAMNDLELFAENDSHLHSRSLEPTIAGMKTKMKANKYDHEKAAKGFSYHVENAAQKYAKEMGGNTPWHQMFPKKDRDVLSKKLADVHHDLIAGGEHAHIGPTLPHEK